MANSFTAIRSKVICSFDSTGASTAITVDGAFLVDVSINFADFVGTIQLQRWTMTGTANAGAWRTIEEYADTDATDGAIEKVFRSAMLRRYRLNCSVATSGGPALAELTAGTRE